MAEREQSCKSAGMEVSDRVKRSREQCDILIRARKCSAPTMLMVHILVSTLKSESCPKICTQRLICENSVS